jgi:3-deoxy-D-manno-octulosonate 8-phosphate phosphatase (KDO 8-P phosphatase)
MPRLTAKQLATRLRAIRLFLCDVDGVMTDGTVWIGAEDEFKRFSIQDGLGLRLLQKNEIKVGWISNRPSTATSARAKELQVDFLCQQTGKPTKVAAAEEVLAKTGLDWKDVCYLGDDIVDLAVLERAGLAVAVANGIAEVKRAAHYVTKAHGGHGAVREVAELILKAQGKWKQIINEHRAK